MIIASLVVAVFAALISALVTILLGWNWSSVAMMYLASGTGSFAAMLIAVALLPRRDDVAEDIEAQLDALREMLERDGEASETIARHRHLVLQMNSREPRSRFGG